MLKYVRKWKLDIAPEKGIKENDIVPPLAKDQDPEEWIELDKYLLDVLAKALEVLSHCHQIHRLCVKITVNEDTPNSTELVLNPIIALRNIRSTKFEVNNEDWYGHRPQWWRLRRSYGRHISRTMALPKGADGEDYDSDEEYIADKDRVVASAGALASGYEDNWEQDEDKDKIETSDSTFGYEDDSGEDEDEDGIVRTEGVFEFNYRHDSDDDSSIATSDYSRYNHEDLEYQLDWAAGGDLGSYPSSEASSDVASALEECEMYNELARDSDDSDDSDSSCE
jgi:hypothetical protein